MYMDPQIIVCTNIRHDHPDVYPTENDTIAAYRKFFEKLPRGGMLLVSFQVNNVIRTSSRGLSEGRGDLTNKIATSQAPRNDRIIVYDQNSELQALIQEIIQVPGDYNLKNAMAAVLAAESIGIPKSKALAALKKFTGLKRRFEFIGESGGVLIYDDYAHHPHEIENLLSAARQKFPDKKIRFVFQPHTFSRTKALFDQFADSLKDIDEVILDPIFASARETVDVEISSEMLAKKINEKGGNAVFIANRQKLVEYLVRTAKPEEVIFTVGAGNLYEIHSELKQGLGKKSP
jgi:UDP-N-acetylmuramate--alanine ligase